MKKIFILIFIYFIFLICSINNNSINYLFTLSDEGEVSFFTSVNYASKTTFSVKNSDNYIINCDLKNAENIYNKINKCFGVSIIVEKSKINIEKIIKNAKIIKKEIINNNLNYFLYLNNLIFSTEIENKKVNLQIVIADEKIILGSPIILGSY